MIKINELVTPRILVDLDKLEENIKEIAKLCQTNNKQLCPMVKTHKSITIAMMQRDWGAKSFLVGTIDEAEKLANNGFENIVLAYPVAADENIKRIVSLISKSHITVCFDGIEAAIQLEKQVKGTLVIIDYLIIVDCGLHRFGVQPKDVVDLVKKIDKLSNLQFKGIATHPGHVYGAKNDTEISQIAKEESDILASARNMLVNAGYSVDIIATGSTPTMQITAKNPIVTTLRPGNYVFYDAIQVALRIVESKRCALTILATIISNPNDNYFIIDAGSKCFGLDKGAHGVSLVKGYGIVKKHPELIIEGLSEEVGKIKTLQSTELKVGDKVEIIPNHACVVANMSSFLIGHRDGIVDKVISVDARNGITQKHF